MTEGHDCCLPDIAERWAQPTEYDRWSAWLNRDVRHEEERRVKLVIGCNYSNGVVLDIGCGPGRYALSLSYVAYYGMDPWLDAVQYARRMTTGMSNCMFHNLGVFDEWPAKPDLVLTMNVFRHFRNPLEGYQHVWDNLPSGAGWVTSFLTHDKSEFRVDGVSSLLPVKDMHRFLDGKVVEHPSNWFHEVGDWWMAYMVKE